MNILSPSVLSADFSKLGEEIKKVDQAGSAYIHLDVMDGSFVPNISFGAPVIASARKVTDKVFDVHLMIEEPIRYIEDFAKAGADLICVHLEACSEPFETLKKIKGYGIKTGIAISPDTSERKLKAFLEHVDMVLIMSVYPGFGGQELIHASLEKVKRVRSMADEKGYHTLDIEVDGGITLENVEEVLRAGANVIVAGSAIFQGDTQENVRQFMKRLEV